jgi:adenine/guanine phosphoribosyltransferase-like PRPP-binding protein
VTVDLRSHIRDVPAFPRLRGLVERLGGGVARCAVVVEPAFLNGREKLADVDVHSLVSYDA